MHAEEEKAAVEAAYKTYKKQKDKGSIPFVYPTYGFHPNPQTITDLNKNDEIDEIFIHDPDGIFGPGYYLK